MAPIAWLGGSRTRMLEVLGSIPRLGGLQVSPFQASGGISILQCRISSLQSNQQGNQKEDSSESNKQQLQQ